MPDNLSHILIFLGGGVVAAAMITLIVLFFKIIGIILDI